MPHAWTLLLQNGSQQGSLQDGLRRITVAPRRQCSARSRETPGMQRLCLWCVTQLLNREQRHLLQADHPLRNVCRVWICSSHLATEADLWEGSPRWLHPSGLPRRRHRHQLRATGHQQLPPPSRFHRNMRRHCLHPGRLCRRHSRRHCRVGGRPC